MILSQSDVAGHTALLGRLVDVLLADPSFELQEEAVLALYLCNCSRPASEIRSRVRLPHSTIAASFHQQRIRLTLLF